MKFSEFIKEEQHDEWTVAPDISTFEGIMEKSSSIKKAMKQFAIEMKMKSEDYNRIKELKPDLKMLNAEIISRDTLLGLMSIKNNPPSVLINLRATPNLRAKHANGQFEFSLSYLLLQYRGVTYQPDWVKSSFVDITYAQAMGYLNLMRHNFYPDDDKVCAWVLYK
jgi:hypothetical protein